MTRTRRIHARGPLSPNRSGVLPIPGSRRAGIAAAVVLLAALLACAAGGCGSKPELKVVIVAIDALDWSVADPLIEQGKMPNLERVVKEGMRADLHSFVPLEKSPTIWTTIATGKGSKKHGIGDFVAATGERPLMNSTGWRARSFWDILSEKGYTVGILNWLVTWPAWEVNGYFIADGVSYSPDDGFEVPERLTYPPELAEEIAPYRVSFASTTDDDIADLLGGQDWRTTDDYEIVGGVETARSLHATDHSVLNISNYLLENKPQPDVYAVYFLGVDRACHRFWGPMDPTSVRGITPEEQELFGNLIPKYYERADGYLGEVLDRIDENSTVIVCSDHGFRGPVYVNGAIKLGIQMHREVGALAAMGPGIRKGAQVTGASVLDVTPTLLALLGEPVGRDMDGFVLTEMIDEDHLAANPVTYIDTYEGEPDPDAEAADEGEEPLESPLDDAIKEELRSLGYIQ